MIQLSKLRIVLKYLKKILPPKVTVLIYRIFAIRYINGLKCDRHQSRKTVLVLNHYYDQDVKAITLANDKYNLLVVNTAILFKGAKVFFSKGVIDLL